VIENIGELGELKIKLETEVSLWYPMWVDNDKHPRNTHISFILIRTLTDRYILPHQHTDTTALSKSQIEGVLNTNGDKWVFQKKKLLQSFSNLRNGLNDIDTAHFLKTGETIDYSQPIQHLVAPLLHKGYKENIIQSIPILKLCEAVDNEFLKHHSQKTKTYNWYNDIFLPILSDIEQFGIRVDREKFIDRWPQAHKHLSSDNLVYTEYNPFTITGRPSNRHGGVNYAALNKSDGSRDTLIADGIFLQMDYDSYHPRLIGKLIDFPLPQTNVHQWLGKESVERGYIQTPNRHIPLSWVEQSNPQKVFNYLLQAYETEINVGKMKTILDYIKGSGISLELYTYDSFLFDVPTDVDKSLIMGLKNIIEEDGYPIKASWGKTYGNL